MTTAPITSVTTSTQATTTPTGAEASEWVLSHDQERVVEEFGLPHTFLVVLGENEDELIAAAGEARVHRLEHWNYHDIGVRISFRDGDVVETGEMLILGSEYGFPAVSPEWFHAGMTPNEVTELLGVQPTMSGDLVPEAIEDLQMLVWDGMVVVSFHQGGLVSVQTLPISDAAAATTTTTIEVLEPLTATCPNETWGTVFYPASWYAYQDGQCQIFSPTSLDDATEAEILDSPIRVEAIFDPTIDVERLVELHQEYPGLISEEEIEIGARSGWVFVQEGPSYGGETFEFHTYVLPVWPEAPERTALLVEAKGPPGSQRLAEAIELVDRMVLAFEYLPYSP